MSVRAAALGALAVCAACGDPVVDMALQLPSNATTFDTSCVASVTVIAAGETYAQDNTDFKRACVDLPMAAPTLADVQTALHGLVSLPIPQTGLAKVAVLGNAASCATLPNDPTAFQSADVIFYASAPYDGDTIQLPMVPNVACPTQQIVAKPVDMLALSTTHACSMSGLPDSVDAGVSIGTFSPAVLGAGVAFGGGLAGAPLAGGLATIANARIDVAASTCLALFAGDDTHDALSCQVTTPPACATGGQLEVAVLSGTSAFMTIDQQLVKQYGPATFGLVYSGSADTGAPVASATVTLDSENAGAVVYLDVPPGAVTGTAPMTKLSTTMTSASGMFLVYTTGFHQLTVAQGGRSKQLSIAAQVSDPGTAIVRLQ